MRRCREKEVIFPDDVIFPYARARDRALRNASRDISPGPAPLLGGPDDFADDDAEPEDEYQPPDDVPLPFHAEARELERPDVVAAPPAIPLFKITKDKRLQ